MAPIMATIGPVPPTAMPVMNRPRDVGCASRRSDAPGSAKRATFTRSGDMNMMLLSRARSVTGRNGSTHFWHGVVQMTSSFAYTSQRASSFSDTKSTLTVPGGPSCTPRPGSCCRNTWMGDRQFACAALGRAVAAAFERCRRSG